MLGALDGILLVTHTQHASNADIIVSVPLTFPVKWQNFSGFDESVVQPKPYFSLNTHPALFWHSVIVGVVATVGFNDIDGLTDGYTLVKVDPPQRQQA